MLKFIKKYLLLILLTFLYVLFKQLNCGFIPDILNLYVLKPSDYFGTILYVTASIFGILIAVMLLIYELLSTKKQEETIFSSVRISNIFYFPVGIIVLSFISYINIDDFHQPNNLTIGYFLGILFIIFIGLLFPAIKIMLDELRTIKKVIKDIKSITIENVIEVLPRQNEKFIAKNNDILLIKIRQELIHYVRECDYSAYGSVLEELNKKTIELIGDGNNRQRTGAAFQALKFIWEAGNFEALRVGNYQYFETLWECIEELYEYAAKKKILLLHFEYLDFFVSDFIQFLIRNKLSDGLTRGVHALVKSFKLNLKHNCPPQEKVSDLYYAFEDKSDVPHFIDESIQWDKIEDFLWDIYKIHSSSIEIPDKELFDLSRFETEHIIDEIGYGEFNNIGIYQEAAILIRIFSEQTHLAYEANEQKLYEDTARTFRLNSSRIADFVKQEKFYSGRILGDISDFIIKSQRKKRLDDHFTLNYWGAIGRHLSTVYLTNPMAKKTMWYILDVLAHLKKIIEENQLPAEAKNYKEIKKQIESLKTWLLKDNKDKEIDIIKKIEEILSSFKDVGGDSDFRIIKWDD